MSLPSQTVEVSRKDVNLDNWISTQVKSPKNGQVIRALYYHSHPEKFNCVILSCRHVKKDPKHNINKISIRYYDDYLTEMCKHDINYINNKPIYWQPVEDNTL